MIKILKSFENISFCVIDGCSSGWIAASICQNTINLTYTFDLENFNKSNIKTIYIDMPVNLPMKILNYPRVSDKNAKKYLGRFHSSIFYAPLRNWLDLSLSQINKICEDAKKPKLSKQSYNLFKKLIEVNKFNQEFSNSLYEIHPELLVHFFLKDKKLSKKNVMGQQQRLAVIHDYFGFKLTLDDLKSARNELLNDYTNAKIQIDDLLDAIFVACLIYCKNYGISFSTIDNVDMEQLNKRLSLFFGNT